MEGIAALAGTTALAALWWWMNRLGKKRGWRAAARHALGVTAGAIGFVIVLGALLPAPSSPALESERVANAPPVPPAAEPAHDISAASGLYISRLRKALNGVVPAEAVVAGEREEGVAHDTLTISVGSSAVVLQLDKVTGAIDGVIAITQGDGTQESGAAALTIGMAAMGTAVEPAEAQETANAALALFATYQGGGAVKRTVGNLEMTYQFSEIAGGMFTIGSAEG